MTDQFYRISKLPPYVFAVINELKADFLVLVCNWQGKLQTFQYPVTERCITDEGVEVRRNNGCGAIERESNWKWWGSRWMRSQVTVCRRTEAAWPTPVILIKGSPTYGYLSWGEG